VAGTGLTRRLRFFERQWPWLVGSALLALFTAAVAVALDAGILDEYEIFPGIARGYTFTGVLLGVSSLVLCGLTFFYAFRKRGLQEALPFGKSTMTAWLWAHVYFGLLALVTAAAHAGYGLISFQFSWGKLAFFGLFAVIVSGLVWRALYALVPKVAAREVGNYSARTSFARAEAILVELEKLSAGASPRFHQLAEWAFGETPSEIQLRQAATSLPPEEQPRFLEAASLEADRQRLLERARKQARYARLLQGMRVLHVPLSLLFLLAVPCHVLFAYDVPARTVPLGAISGAALGAFESAEKCGNCHARAVSEWRHSMHAHAMTSPVMVSQGNRVLAQVLAQAPYPDPKRICVNCHGPIGAALTSGTELPLRADSALRDDALLNEGISCSVCHQWDGTPETASGGLTKFQSGLHPGHTYYGAFNNPVGNAFHQSEATTTFRAPEQLCRNCHSVEYDKNNDGQLHRGADLVLQTLFDEWQDYKRAGGTATCVSCHMPLVRETRAAEHATIPFEQDHEAPNREVHDHSFVAADYPLDDPAARDALHAARAQLLAHAASLVVTPGSLKSNLGSLAFNVEVGNTGTGHNLPGGFAFVRQMWLEVTLLNARGQVVASSGQLLRPTDDLCDASILEDPNNGMKEFLVGCAATDRQLVSFQQMLMDKIELLRDSNGVVQKDLRNEPKLRPAPGAKEAVVQFLTGGPVPRVRPSTGKPTPPLIVGEQRAFPYVFDLPATAGAEKVRVRLLFRAAPPYFLRALAKTQTPADGPSLNGVVQNLEINEMARLEAPLARPN